MIYEHLKRSDILRWELGSRKWLIQRDIVQLLLKNAWKLLLETSLHRDLKLVYASDASKVEVTLAGYRIDAIDSEGALVEVQHAGLGSIRDKIRDLCKSHRVRVIKPLIRNKRIENSDPKTGTQKTTRKSPKHACFLDIFPELLHFTSVFPHANLTLEVPLVDVVEIREPRPHRYRRKKQFRIVDQRLDELGESRSFKTKQDLWDLLEIPTPADPFGTAELSQWLERPRWFAQQIAYVLDRCGVIKQVGKSGNSKQYKKGRRSRRVVAPKSLQQNSTEFDVRLRRKAL